MTNICEPPSDKIPCSKCGAIDQWRLEERKIPFPCGVIVCTNCGEVDSGFFIGETK